MTSAPTALRGQLLYFVDDPFLSDPEASLIYERDGLLLMEGGLIRAVGPASALLPTLPEGTAIHHEAEHLILPGFIDAHVHYSQLAIIGSYGEQLLTWLNKYTFPAERRFQDAQHAAEIAQAFIDALLRNGTTAASVFCTVHPQSVSALFEAAERLNMRLSAGKVLMDRNAPEGLLDTPQRAYDESRALIDRWHQRGRALYCVTPRFAITSTPAQLEVAASLYHETPGALLQSHVSENVQEIDTVRQLFPQRADYVDVYAHYGLLGPRTIYGHGVHFTEADWRRFHEAGAAIAHCPTSNFFIGSGLFDISAAKNSARPVRVGLATDVGGGTSFSMLRTLAEAYKMAQLRGYPLSAREGFYLATLGSARALYLDDIIGTFAPGMEADAILIDPHATPLLAKRMQSAQTLDERLFVLMTLGDDRVIRATYVAGKRVYQRP